MAKNNIAILCGRWNAVVMFNVHQIMPRRRQLNIDFALFICFYEWSSWVIFVIKLSHRSFAGPDVYPWKTILKTTNNGPAGAAPNDYSANLISVMWQGDCIIKSSSLIFYRHFWLFCSSNSEATTKCQSISQRRAWSGNATNVVRNFATPVEHAFDCSVKFQLQMRRLLFGHMIQAR